MFAFLNSHIQMYLTSVHFRKSWAFTDGPKTSEGDFKCGRYVNDVMSFSSTTFEN